jgi:hypothetical protein
MTAVVTKRNVALGVAGLTTFIGNWSTNVTVESFYPGKLLVSITEEAVKAGIDRIVFWREDGAVPCRGKVASHFLPCRLHRLHNYARQLGKIE